MRRSQHERTAMPEEYQPHYKWKLTYPDRKADFTGTDVPNRFARFHIHHLGFWIWSVLPYFVLKQVSIAPTAGRAETAREAARASEECYDRILAGTWTGM